MLGDRGVDAVRAAVEAPTSSDAQQAADQAIVRAQTQTGVPLRLQLDGTFARGAVLRAETSAQIGLASLFALGAALAPSFPLLLAACLGLGCVSCVPQQLVPFAAQISPPA